MIRLDMLQCCAARKEPTDKLVKGIRQTLTDQQSLQEIPPHWLELAAATLASSKVQSLPPQSKEPILHFAHYIRELSLKPDDNLMRPVWENLVMAMIRSGDRKV